MPIISHILAPVIILSTIIAVDAIGRSINDVNNPNPIPYRVNHIPDCHEYKHETDTCTTVGYGILGEEKPWVNASMQHLAKKWGLTFGDGKDVAQQWTGTNSTKYLEYLGNNAN